MTFQSLPEVDTSRPKAVQTWPTHPKWFKNLGNTASHEVEARSTLVAVSF